MSDNRAVIVQKRVETVMNDRRRFFRVFAVLLAFGVANLLRMLGRPALTAIRPVDVVQLIGTGMCLGGAIVALVFALTKG